MIWLIVTDLLNSLDKVSGPAASSARCSLTRSSFQVCCTDFGTCFITRWINKNCSPFLFYFLNNTNLFDLKGPSLTVAHVLGLAVLVVHLHASVSDDTMVQLVPPVQPQPVPLAEALSSALLCDTRTNMLFSVRLDFRFHWLSLIIFHPQLLKRGLNEHLFFGRFWKIWVLVCLVQGVCGSGVLWDL